MQPASRDPFAMGPREHLNQIINIVATARNGDHRFLPLLMSKVTEVLPRLVNPMLQNAPENSNLANIDIFDGFGNGGMAQPPQMQLHMDGDFDRKFSAEEYDKKFAMEMSGSTPESASHSNNSGATPPGQQTAGSDLGSSFVSSPPMMSPTVDYPHNMYGCTPINDMVMSPLGNPGQSGHFNSSQVQHQHQHMASQQQMNHGHDAMGQHLNSMSLQGIRPRGMSNTAIQSPHQMNAMSGIRSTPQRQDSFNLTSQGQMRTVGDFHSLQRGGTDTMVGMNAMSSEIDFGGLR